VDGLSSRDLAGKYRVGRRTVALALSSAWPEPRKKLPPRKSRLDRHKEAIDRILRADLDAPRKQRHTTKRIFDRLIAEHDADGISYPMVRAYVAGRKPEIWVEAGRGPPQVFIPQAHQPGQDAEAGFGDVYIDLAGVRTLCYMFVFRLSFSGKAVHRVSASEGQEAFFEGHAHAFSVLGGVPAGKVRYDNLTSAVARVLGFTRARVETDRWTAFRSWAGFSELGHFLCVCAVMHLLLALPSRRTCQRAPGPAGVRRLPCTRRTRRRPPAGWPSTRRGQQATGRAGSRATRSPPGRRPSRYRARSRPSASAAR
jgi:transposase